MMEKKLVFLLLGSNLGDRLQTLNLAVEAINRQIGPVRMNSGIYDTVAFDMENSPNFLNQAIAVETNLSPELMLQTIHRIEHSFGRVRNSRHNGYASRTLDIDILYIDNLVIETGELTVPHPQLHKRRFALVPLNEIAPDFIHPVLYLSNHDLLVALPDDPDNVKRII